MQVKVQAEKLEVRAKLALGDVALAFFLIALMLLSLGIPTELKMPTSTRTEASTSFQMEAAPGVLRLSTQAVTVTTSSLSHARSSWRRTPISWSISTTPVHRTYSEKRLDLRPLLRLCAEGKIVERRALSHLCLGRLQVLFS
jgi:hypothetical protein